MKREKNYLIMATEDVSIYVDELAFRIPSSKKIGGFITVVNNHNGEERWKEWKWYRHEDGTMFNDMDYVVNMLVNTVGKLHLKD